MKFYVAFITLFILHSNSYAQSGRTVSGTVKDTLNNSVIGATIKLTSSKDSLMIRTDIDGNFTIKDVKSATFLISITSLGYKNFNQRYFFNEENTPVTLPPIILKSQSQLLNEVIISGIPPVTVKEDTLEYRTKDYKLRDDALTEDLLKKLPGVSVDNNGNVTAQGQTVTKVRINGKDYFGGDVKTATQNLPADIVDKIQIVDDYGDQANITGIKTGDPNKVLDIHIRPDKNKGYVARATLAKGTDERYQASIAANALNNTQQIALLGNFNNTNTATFGIDGGGNSRFPRPNNNSSSGNGITTLNSIGFNYRDDWSKKLASYGSYSYANNNNTLLTSSVQQNNYESDLILIAQDLNSNTITNSHRFNWNFEYKIDSLNYLKISPTFTYSKTDGDTNTNYNLTTNGISSPNTAVLTLAGSETPNVTGNILYNHRFRKKGRNISLDITGNTSKNIQTTDVTTNSSIVYQHQTQNINSNAPNYTSNLSYLEPLNKTSFLELNYVRYHAAYNNSRETNDIDQAGIVTLNNALSNKYNYTFTTDRIGVNYRVNEKKYNYYIGASVQPSALSGESKAIGIATRTTAFDIIPSGRFSYNFSKTRSFNVGFIGKRSEPSYTQLQPNIDQSNPQFPVQGNPNLNAEFIQTLRMRYNNFNFDKGDILFTVLSASYTRDKVVTNTTKYNSTGNIIQQTDYLNANGYYTINGFYLWSKPFAEKKYVFSINGSVNYNNNISYIEGQKNTGKNWVLSQGFNAQINPQSWLEINPGVTYTYNTNNNDILTQTNTQVSTWAFSFNSKTYLRKTWLLGTDMRKNINSGYKNISQNPFIMNIYFEKQLLKGNIGALRLQAYDLLNQNANVTRTITGNSITDSRNNQLGRYFMLSFTLRLQNFSGISAQNILTPKGPRRGDGSGSPPPQP